MEQYWRGRGWEFDEIAKELHRVKSKTNKTNKTKLSLAITADCSIFFLPCQTKTLPVTAFSSSPTFQFLSYSNVSQTARCTPSRGGRRSRAQRENERCKKPVSASLAFATSLRLPISEIRALTGKILNPSFSFSTQNETH